MITTTLQRLVILAKLLCIISRNCRWWWWGRPLYQPSRTALLTAASESLTDTHCRVGLNRFNAEFHGRNPLGLGRRKFYKVSRKRAALFTSPFSAELFDTEPTQSRFVCSSGRCIVSVFKPTSKHCSTNSQSYNLTVTTFISNTRMSSWVSGFIVAL